ncbi:EAL domain-containing protein [Enterocloster citroniae]|nr:EAL domain-containing protein [Enterocloster citroniae]
MPHNPLLFSSPLLVMITDTMGRIIFIHENMKQFLGHPVSDYMGMDIESVVGEITKKNPFTTSRYPDLKMIFPFRGDNYCLSFQKVLLDEHVEVTMALLQRSGDMERQTVYHFASILNSGICILQYTETLTIVSANEACYRVYGYTPKQFAEEKNNSPVSLIHPDDRMGIREKLNQSIARGEHYVSFEMRCFCRDGSMIWVEVKSTLLRENDMDILVCLIWDITEKKQLEHEISLNVQRYKIALSKSHNLIWEYHMDEDWACIENTTDSPFREAEIIRDFSKQTFESARLDQEYLPAFRQMFRDLKDGRTMTSAVIRATPGNGEEKWYRITHTLLSHGSRPGNVAIGVAEDISREHQEQERYQQEEKYRQALVGGALASYEIDIDDDRIMEMITEKNKDMLASVGLSENCSYSRFLDRWSEQNVHPQDRGLFLRELNPQYLRRQYENGRQEVVCEYRSLNADEKMVWCNTTIYLILSGGHLSGFVYVRNIEEKKHKELELLRQSRIDPLTGLLNRAACLQEINRMLKDQAGALSALLMIDVDNFKAVNDNYGHMYGDKVLAGIAYKLKSIFEDNAVLGRLGGDEFVAFMPDIPNDAAACNKAQIIARELQSTQEQGEDQMGISNSIGIAFCPRHGNKFDELYIKADAALRYAKQAGKSCYSVFGSKTSQVAPLQYVNREWLIDELEEIVYISDIQDHSLIYLNRAGRELTGLKMEEFETCKCYEVLQGRDSPCPFCTNTNLSTEEYYVWEYENPYLRKNFIVKDKLVEWNGRLVRMEIAVDVGSKVLIDSNITSKYHMETVMLESLRALNSAGSLEEAIDRVLSLIADFYDGERAYIAEIDRKRGVISNTYEWCRKGISPQKSMLQNVPVEKIPYIYETIHNKQHLIIARADELKHTYPSEYQYLSSRGAHSLFAVPFEDEAMVSGYIGVDNPTINQDTIRLLDSIALNISGEMKKRRLYHRLEYEASHDALSGLLNRGSFVQYQEKLDRSMDRSCGIVAADINGLKQLNRDYGHSLGDQVIVTASSVMRACFPESRIFRLSGDEFVIIVLGMDYDGFMEQVKLMGNDLDMETPNGVSLGCTWVEHLTDFNTTLHHAEELMIVNKQIYYKISDDVRKHYSPESAKKLFSDMEHGYYKIYLQPKLDSATGGLRSVEALARYHDPGQEVKPPGKFVPLLEKVKLIRYLDFYMLEQVLKLLCGWKEKGRPLVPVSVNFSRITLLESDLFRILREIKSRYDIPSGLVMIEITESIGDIEHKVIESIGSRLRQAGFKLSLDDFGSNYANMSILSIIHFDEVKLDKSLIDNLAENETNQTVVKCIVNMCRSLDVECVAEGVETREQLELLKSFGCRTIQGYYFSKPVEAGQFETNDYKEVLT